MYFRKSQPELGIFVLEINTRAASFIIYESRSRTSFNEASERNCSLLRIVNERVLHHRVMPTMSKIYSEASHEHSSTFDINLQYSRGDFLARYNRHADRDFLRKTRLFFFYTRLRVLSRVAGKTTPMPQVYCVRAAVAGFVFRGSLRALIRIYRVAETKGAGRTEPWVPSFSLFPVFFARCRPFLSFSLSLSLFLSSDAQPVDTRLIRLAGRIDACVHALSSQRDDW